jgi:hypothetical protein
VSEVLRLSRSRLLLLALVVIAVASCSDGSGSASPTGSPPADSAPLELETYQGDGFSMLLPAGWTIVTAGDVDFTTLFADAGDFADSEALAQQVSAAFEQGGKLFAIDLSTAASGFATNINVIELPLPALTIAEVEAVTVQQFEDLVGATEVSSEVRRLPAGEAAVVSYRMPAYGNQGIGVTLLTESTQWVITLSALDLSPLSDAFWSMIESFRESAQ